MVSIGLVFGATAGDDMAWVTWAGGMMSMVIIIAVMST
jgi:hypothetical protein